MNYRKVIYAAAFAAIYVALCAVLQPISFGPIQFRFSEILCLFAIDFTWAFWGVSIGCLLANLLIGGLGMMDVIFGTAATVAGCLLAHMFRNKLVRGYPILSTMMIVLTNAIIIGEELGIILDTPDMIPLYMLEVGFGELVVLLIGLPIYKRILTVFKTQFEEVE